jgi:hypothetical protein
MSYFLFIYFFKNRVSYMYVSIVYIDLKWNKNGRFI